MGLVAEFTMVLHGIHHVDYEANNGVTNKTLNVLLRAKESIISV